MGGLTLAECVPYLKNKRTVIISIVAKGEARVFGDCCKGDNWLVARSTASCLGRPI